MNLFDRAKRGLREVFMSEEALEKRESGSQLSESLHKLKFAVELNRIEKEEGNTSTPYSGALSGSYGLSGFVSKDGMVHQVHPLKLFYDIYEAHTWTRTAIEAIGKAFHAVGYMVKSDDQTDLDSPETNKKEKDALTLFFKNVNSENGENHSLGELLYKIVIDYLICGNAYIRVRYRADGYVKSLSRIDPSNMFAFADQYGKILKWVYKAPGFDAVTIQTKEIIQFKEHNPKNDIYGLPKMTNLLSAITSDMYVLQFNKMFFKNNASIGKIFEQDADDITIERNRLILKKQYTGSESSHKNLILQSGKQTVGAMKLVYAGDRSAYEMGFIELRKSSREEVFALYGTPMEVVGVGDAGALGGDTTSESFEVFHKNTIAPMLEIIYGRFSKMFIEGVMGLKGICIGAKDRQAFLSKGQAVAVYTAARTGVLRLNELREFLGRPPVEGGDILVVMRPDGMFPTKVGIRGVDPGLNIDDILAELAAAAGGGPDDKAEQMQDRNVGVNNVTPRAHSGKSRVNDAEILAVIQKTLGEEYATANKVIDGEESDLWLLGDDSPEMAIKVEIIEGGLAVDVVGRGTVQALGSIRHMKGNLTEYGKKLYA